jgi:predicted secreted protein
MPKGTLTHAKKKAIDDAMNWLRNNDPNPADVTIRQPRGWRTLLLPCPAVCLRRRRPEWLRIQ